MSQPIYSVPPDWKRHDDVMVVQGALPWTRKPEFMQPIWDAGIDGSNVIVINLDTGYKPHVDLPTPIEVRNFTGGNASDVTDRHGHGCHTIGSAVGRNGIGAAPKARLKVGKVLGDNGSGSNTIAGLNWAADQEGDIVSCSWGGGNSVDPGTEAALKRIEQSGKAIVFSAGNSGYNGRNTVIAPALSPTVECIASHNSDYTISGFSSGGPRIDAAAGGGAIISAGLNNDRVLMSGTSMACPTYVGDRALLIDCMKKLGMRTNLKSREWVEFIHSEKFLRDAGVVGRDNVFGMGILMSNVILSWITNKLKSIVVCWILFAFVFAASSQAQFDNPTVDVPQKQVTFLRAQSATLIEDAGKILILAEELSPNKEFGVVLAVPASIVWAEIHDVVKPFPPSIQKPNGGNVYVMGVPGQQFWVSLRSNDPPAWLSVTVAPTPGPTDPPPPPPIGDFAALTQLSKTQASRLDRETGLAIRTSILSSVALIESKCSAGECPTFDAAKKIVTDAINSTPKKQSFDWYGEWRMPVSQAIIKAGVSDTKTYLAAMRAVSAGLE